MASSAWSSGISGAASGAATGASIGTSFPGYGSAIGAGVGAVVGGLAGIFSGSSSDDQFDNQLAWSMYNASSQYNVNMSNILGQTMLASLNADLAMQAASYNAQALIDTSTLNAQLITSTTLYNNSLLDNELSLLWDAMDLDLMYIEEARARERGEIIANQGASGTVIGMDSNAAVVADQMAQEAMDAMVVRHGANIAAADIHNQQAQNTWQGQVAVQKTMWEGEMGSFLTMENARLQAMGIKASAGLSALSGMQSAEYALESAFAGIDQAQDQYSAENTQNMVSGLFSAAATAVKTGYSNATAGGSSSSSTGSLVAPYSSGSKYQSLAVV